MKKIFSDYSNYEIVQEKPKKFIKNIENNSLAISI